MNTMVGMLNVSHILRQKLIRPTCSPGPTTKNGLTAMIVAAMKHNPGSTSPIYTFGLSHIYFCKVTTINIATNAAGNINIILSGSIPITDCMIVSFLYENIREIF